MTKISIDLNWKLDKGTLSPGKYSNIHEIKFNPNISVKADSAPDWNGDPNQYQSRTNFSSIFKQLSYDDFFGFGSKNELASIKL